MKILYAIQGTGNGHVSRAREIIPILKKYGQVDILISGTQADVNLDDEIKYRFKGFGFDFGTNGGINYKSSFKTARTNEYALEILKEYFPKKRIIDLDLKKNDKVPYEGVLHLDCTFNPVGKDKCIIYKNGFVDQNDYELIIDIFGEENCFHVTDEEMFEMNPNIFSISPEVVVSDKTFTRMNNHFRDVWGLTVEEIPYREVSKMGGLLRCSTMPLVRE